MDQKLLLLEVLIEKANHSLDRPFSYLYSGNKSVQVGYRVLLEFNHQELVGYVINIKDITGQKEEIEE